MTEEQKKGATSGADGAQEPEAADPFAAMGPDDEIVLGAVVLHAQGKAVTFRVGTVVTDKGAFMEKVIELAVDYLRRERLQRKMEDMLQAPVQAGPVKGPPPRRRGKLIKPPPPRILRPGPG